MFKQASDIQAPPAETVIWRYMDLTKFLSILETGTLFFPTLNMLRKIDPWEGSWSNFNFAEYVGGTEESQKASRDWLFPRQYEVFSKQMCISCWYMKEDETRAMWKWFLTGSEGIAVRTTFGELKQCFDYDHSSWHYMGGNFSDRKVHLIGGAVQYIDWEYPPENTHTLQQAMFKDKSFEHERELRIVARLHAIPGSLPFDLDEEGKWVEDTTFELSPSVLKQINELNGIYLPILRDQLIKDVYIAPTAPHWFAELVESICIRYGLTIKPHWNAKLPRY